MNSSNVWLWRCPERSCLDKILNHINASALSKNDILLLNCEDVAGFEKSVPITNFFFYLSLKFNLLEDEHTMFLNLKDMISSIELYLGRQRNNEPPQNESLDEAVCSFFNKYINSFGTNEKDSDDELISLFKSFLRKNNCIDVRILLDEISKYKNNDIRNYINGYRYLILGKPCSVVLKQLIGILNGQIHCINLETPLDSSLNGSLRKDISEEIKIDMEYLELKEIAVNTDHQSDVGSATEEYAEDLILSFLSLLINSRNELTLSKVMISPVINFSHEAFTALKHLSIEKEMSMCQVAISYVTRLRLGGKGYAPAGDCPMLPHLKNLELFVDTLNQMQTLIEEESCPSTVVKRLINILRKKLLKCSNEKLKESSVEAVSENLQSTYLAVADILKTRISSTSSQICQGTLDILYHFVNFVNCNSLSDNPQLILAKKHIKRTPLNLPPLLGYFKTPEEESSCDTKSSLNEDSVHSRNSLVHRLAFPSYFHQSESSEVSMSCINSSTPSKLSFKGCLKESGEKLQNRSDKKVPEIISENSQDAEPLNKKQKRSILGEITNENFENNTMRKDGKSSQKSLNEKTIQRLNNKKQNKKEPKRSVKKFKQIRGQGKITSFFVHGKS